MQLEDWMRTAPKQNWSMADVYITDELNRRTPKRADYRKEKLALRDLAARMADRPEDVLPRFVDLAMEMTGGVSAGLSLYEENPPPGIFRWRYSEAFYRRSRRLRHRVNSALAALRSTAMRQCSRATRNEFTTGFRTPISSSRKCC